MLLLGWTHLFAQQDLTMENIQPFRDGDTLKCSFASPDLFEGRVGKALLSGLPVLVELHSEVLQKETKPARVESYRLSYDIWEDEFLLESRKTSRTFSSLSELRNWWNPRPDLELTRVENLDKGQLAIKLRMRVVLLSRSQSERLREWILNPSEVEDNAPSYKRDTGFTLNLNRLVSFFLNKDDISETFEVTSQSEQFQITELKKEE